MELLARQEEFEKRKGSDHDDNGLGALMRDSVATGTYVVLVVRSLVISSAFFFEPVKLSLCINKHL